MNREDIIAKVNQALTEEFELNPEDLLPDAAIRDLGLDSLDYLDMVIILENEFHFKIKDQKAIEKIKTIGDIYNLVEGIANKHAPSN